MDKHKEFPSGLMLVSIQVLASSALVLLARLDWSNWLWLVPGCVGIVLGVWSVVAIGARRVSMTPDVRPETKLVTTGPYRLIRHPMYSALLLFTSGFVFIPFHFWKLGTWFVLLIVLIAKTRIEERHLAARFTKYEGYQDRSWRFVPYIW